jgi:hypothetical protein
MATTGGREAYQGAMVAALWPPAPAASWPLLEVEAPPTAPHSVALSATPHTHKSRAHNQQATATQRHMMGTLCSSSTSHPTTAAPHLRLLQALVRSPIRPLDEIPAA